MKGDGTGVRYSEERQRTDRDVSRLKRCRRTTKDYFYQELVDPTLHDLWHWRTSLQYYEESYNFNTFQDINFFLSDQIETNSVTKGFKKLTLGKRGCLMDRGRIPCSPRLSCIKVSVTETLQQNRILDVNFLISYLEIYVLGYWYFIFRLFILSDV